MVNEVRDTVELTPLTKTTVLAAKSHWEVAQTGVADGHAWKAVQDSGTDVWLNGQAFARLSGPKAGATHVFPELGALEAVTDLAIRWFEHHLISGALAVPSAGR